VATYAAKDSLDVYIDSSSILMGGLPRQSSVQPPLTCLTNVSPQHLGCPLADSAEKRDDGGSMIKDF
jgi:hypothetical protein